MQLLANGPAPHAVCHPVCLPYSPAALAFRTPAEDIDFKYPLRRACVVEISIFCKDVPHGHARVVRCLQVRPSTHSLFRQCHQDTAAALQAWTVALPAATGVHCGWLQLTSPLAVAAGWLCCPGLPVRSHPALWCALFVSPLWWHRRIIWRMRRCLRSVGLRFKRIRCAAGRGLTPALRKGRHM